MIQQPNVFLRRLEGLFLLGMGCQGRPPSLHGAQGHSTAPHFHPCENQQGMEEKSVPIKGIGNAYLELCHLQSENGGPATVFPCGNEDDREG